MNTSNELSIVHFFSDFVTNQRTCLFGGPFFEIQIDNHLEDRYVQENYKINGELLIFWIISGVPTGIG